MLVGQFCINLRVGRWEIVAWNSRCQYKSDVMPKFRYSRPGVVCDFFLLKTWSHADQVASNGIWALKQFVVAATTIGPIRRILNVEHICGFLRFAVVVFVSLFKPHCPTWVKIRSQTYHWRLLKIFTETALSHSVVWTVCQEFVSRDLSYIVWQHGQLATSRSQLVPYVCIACVVVCVCVCVRDVF